MKTVDRDCLLALLDAVAELNHEIPTTHYRMAWQEIQGALTVLHMGGDDEGVAMCLDGARSFIISANGGRMASLSEFEPEWIEAVKKAGPYTLPQDIYIEGCDFCTIRTIQNSINWRAA